MKENKRIINLSWIKAGIICIMLGFLTNPVIALANPYSGGNSNCTWYVWQRANDKIGVQLPGWGNAGTWYASAQNAGYSVGTEPRADSVAVYSNSYVGHVAYVESVNGSQIYVSEGGYYTNGTKGYHEGWTPAYGRRWPNDSKNIDTIIGYIYLSANGETPTQSNTLTISANATYKTTDDITITWNSITGADKYGLSVWKPPYDGDENLVFDQFVYGNSHNIGKLSAGTYRCKMAAWSNGSMGTKSNEIYFDVEEADTEPPIITNVVVSDVSTLGYTITCTVSDNSGINRVQFPTWTLNNKQDDIQQDWGTNEKASGTINGNTVTYRVNDSDHNYEKGTYRTHIYAYDIYGNHSSAGVDVNVENQYTSIDSVTYKGNTYIAFNDNLSFEEAKQKCIELGGHPAVISDAEENTVITRIIQNGGRKYYWLGATRINDTWYWETGETFNYSNWAEGEPNNYQQLENKCEISKSGTWNDISDTDKSRGFICEIESVLKPTATPKPTTTIKPIISEVPKVTETAEPTTEVIQKPKITAKPTITSKPKNNIKAPGKPSIKSAKNIKGKKVVLKLKKKVKGAKGYQITYATNSKFTKGKKNIYMTSTSKTITKLKKGKTYYVKVRAYKKNSKGEKVYGKYSNVKKVKIKK